ncbi:hypothetical protein PCC9214_03987 [Planktothrix tepida]|jgi:hypothetical protein|uniref:Uncharacterized protein n=2 Tax=Planktothrix TaxID=54304 RepID=A0A1J1LQA2_9CYAN|nr:MULTISPECIES: hypothetical protein [Planktothrix]CAD5936789.1 hypothetical protein NO713_01651 [Planktothrix pseudagardhii]CAD5973548.1 hypothetical protein PCC9214_03987 [Planktothrix tepida]CUR34414.1 hypothetical protein PL9214640421 [Planktothrix tepida PCC 9214]
MPLQWNQQPDHVKQAFLDQKATLVILPKGMKLWKLTGYKPSRNPNIHRFTPPITPWWSNYDPFKDDTRGVKGVLKDSIAKSQIFLAYVRDRSAVTIEWNSLTYYMETKLLNDKEAFWGRYAPQPVSKNPIYQTLYDGVYYPEALGGWPDAFQLYIPNLQTADLATPEWFSSTDNKALKAQFGI